MAAFEVIVVDVGKSVVLSGLVVILTMAFRHGLVGSCLQSTIWHKAACSFLLLLEATRWELDDQSTQRTTCGGWANRLEKHVHRYVRIYLGRIYVRYHLGCNKRRNA